MQKILSILLTINLLLSGAAIVEDGTTNADLNLSAEEIMVKEVVFEDEFLDISLFQTRATNNITINMVGMSTYLNFTNMGNDFDASLVEYSSDNADVAIAWDGRILARGVGYTQITIKYNDLQQVVNVNVQNDIPTELVDALYTVQATRTARLSSERTAIINKGADMTAVSWTPTSDLTGWKNGYTFKSGTTYFGVPYSQTPNQVDDIGFINAMSNANFYTAYNGTMPRYGSDCSGFVSFAWGISRTTTATFYNYSSIGDYSNLEPGDAVVYRSGGAGHIILVGVNMQTPPSGSSYNESYLVCYEQTPYDAELTFNTYSQLSSKGYKAISKFN